MELDHAAVEEEQSAGNAGWNSIWCRVCKFCEWIAKGREMNDIVSTGFSNWSGTCLAYVGPGSGICMLWRNRAGMPFTKLDGKSRFRENLEMARLFK